ncbi:alpha/beta fold hydrolase [Bacteroidota bacterium]
MKTLKKSIFISITLLFVSISIINCQTISADIGKYREAPCPFPLPEGLVLGENFKFGYVSVPEFHSNPKGKTLELAVAIFLSSDSIHESDPIVMNTSGPGKSNMDNFIPQIAGGLGSYLLPHRDIVIIELRGLRYSKPFLMCEELFNAKKWMLDKNLSTDETMAILEEALQASKDRFDKEQVNLAAFNNVETAADIAMILSELGYDKFNIVGSSAGTLVAHHVIRDYPERVRCAIMDAGLPIDSTIFKDYVPNIIQTLQQYFEECRNDPQCNAAYPDLENRYLNLIDTLNQNPLIFPVNDPNTGELIQFVFNGHQLSAFTLFNVFYSTQLPLIIGKILDGDYSDIEQYALSFLIPNYFSDGLGITVFISEVANYCLSDIDIAPNYSVFAEGIKRSGMGGAYFEHVQNIWNIPKLDMKEIQYKGQYDTPVLVLNGVYDPVIPIKYDELMKKHLSNCYIYRFDGVPHSAFDNATPCVLPMFLEFLNDPSHAPDNRCMENYLQVYKVKGQE